jgi:hypothetical protein
MAMMMMMVERRRPVDAAAARQRWSRRFSVCVGGQSGRWSRVMCNDTNERDRLTEFLYLVDIDHRVTHTELQCRIHHTTSGNQVGI